MANEINIRLAREGDLESLSKLFEAYRAFYKQVGNNCQLLIKPWQSTLS